MELECQTFVVWLEKFFRWQIAHVGALRDGEKIYRISGEHLDFGIRMLSVQSCGSGIFIYPSIRTLSKQLKMFSGSWRQGLSMCLLASIAFRYPTISSVDFLVEKIHTLESSLSSTYFVHVYETFFFFSFARLKQK